MLDFRTILFPVDFSDAAKQAAPYVCGIACRFDAELVVLHALDLSRAAPAAPFLQPQLLAPYENLICGRREAELATFIEKSFPGMSPKSVLEVGDAAEAITRYAERNEVDLIVMPTHGLGRFRWLLLGSVTAKVLHDSKCPVWTTVHAETLPTLGTDTRTILCGVDLASEPTRVMQAASDLAKHYGAVVRLVHAIYVPESKPGSNMYDGLKRFLFDTAREWITKHQAEAGTNWDVCIESGAVANVLREMAAQSRADLIVIGRGRLQNHLGRLRTNVGAIIRQASCPVLSV